MLIDRLTSCLEDLSKLLDIELKPDNNHSCLIKIKDKLEVQLELDRENQDYLIIGSLLGELPSGKFREEILFSALKANARSYPRIGSFAYSTKLNNLVLYELLNLNQISPETILSILTSFGFLFHSNNSGKSL